VASSTNGHESDFLLRHFRKVRSPFRSSNAFFADQRPTPYRASPPPTAVRFPPLRRLFPGLSLQPLPVSLIGSQAPSPAGPREVFSPLPPWKYWEFLSSVRPGPVPVPCPGSQFFKRTSPFAFSPLGFNPDCALFHKPSRNHTFLFSFGPPPVFTVNHSPRFFSGWPPLVPSLPVRYS